MWSAEVRIFVLCLHFTHNTIYGRIEVVKFKIYNIQSYYFELLLIKLIKADKVPQLLEYIYILCHQEEGAALDSPSSKNMSPHLVVMIHYSKSKESSKT